MIGWIILLLLLGGLAICAFSLVKTEQNTGTADARMGEAFIFLVGAAMVALALIILIGADIYKLM